MRRLSVRPTLPYPAFSRLRIKLLERERYWKVSSKVNFQFLNLPWHPRIESFIAEHMMMMEAGEGEEGRGPPQHRFHAESKLSRTIAGKWKDQLAETELSKLREGKGSVKYKSMPSPCPGTWEGFTKQILKEPFP